MRHPVSPIFHGRDIFAPAAAYLSKGVKIVEFGKEINQKDLVNAPYEEAVAKGNEMAAKIISINKYGSFHLNIMHEAWDKFNVKLGEKVNWALTANLLKCLFSQPLVMLKKESP